MNSETECQLELKSINTYYGKSHILYDVSMKVRKGELVGLLGRNGVGKSTTLNSIMGVVTPQSGSIIFEGNNICGLQPYQIARRGIGIVPEERRIFPTITVRENLLMGQKPAAGSQGNEWTIDKIYEYMPLLKKLDGNKGGCFKTATNVHLAQWLSMAGYRVLLIDIDQQGHGSGGVVLVECVGEGLALGIARQPELRSVARLGVELLDVAVEVRVVLRRDAQRLQVGELAQRIRLAQLELVVARHFLRTQRHHAEAAVRHRGHLSQCAVGVVDSYSR